MARVWVSQMFEAIADLGRHYFERPSSAAIVERATGLCRDLMSVHGEASGTAIAREVITTYGAMDNDERLAFLKSVASEYAPEAEALLAAASAYIQKQDDASYYRLYDAMESRRQELFRRINMAPGGTAVIVRMRELLLKQGGNGAANGGGAANGSGNGAANADGRWLTALEIDLKHLLASWFNRGFLQFEQIDWRTPAVILEKLIAYEAVHEIRGWEDLRRRLAADRRCFAFFHPALPDEPLIFVEVALTQGLAGEIQPLIDSPPVRLEDHKPDTAIFYSISNCQTGLAGISFGNFLIKQVVDALSHEMPGLKNFATLSPIPGFRKWLGERLAGATPPERLSEQNLKLLKESDWVGDEVARQRLKPLLTSLCAEYLAREKRGAMPRDPVARFHLGNGASIERINWMGDISEKGIAQSVGMMVNYLYDSDQIVANHEAFIRDNKIAISSSVKALLNKKR